MRREPIDASREVRVLLVEDNAADATLTKRALARAANIDCKVTDARSVLTAKMALANRAFDVVLLDLGLPDMQGIDAVVEVRKATSQTPILVLSGQDNPTVARNAQHAGADGYLTKRGLDPKSAEREINRVIHEHYRKQQERRLYVRTRARLSDTPPTGTATPAVCSPHIDALEKTIDGLCAYLARNAPAHLGPARAIVEQHGATLAAQELRALLEVETDPRGDRRRPDSITALAAVLGGKGEAEVDSRATADAAILDVIS